MDMFIYDKQGLVLVRKENVAVVPAVDDPVEVLVTVNGSVRVVKGLVLERHFRYSDNDSTGAVHVHLV